MDFKSKQAKIAFLAIGAIGVAFFTLNSVAGKAWTQSVQTPEESKILASCSQLLPAGSESCDNQIYDMAEKCNAANGNISYCNDGRLAGYVTSRLNYEQQIEAQKADEKQEILDSFWRRQGYTQEEIDAKRAGN